MALNANSVYWLIQALQKACAQAGYSVDQLPSIDDFVNQSAKVNADGVLDGCYPILDQPVQLTGAVAVNAVIEQQSGIVRLGGNLYNMDGSTANIMSDAIYKLAANGAASTGTPVLAVGDHSVALSCAAEYLDAGVHSIKVLTIFGAPVSVAPATKAAFDAATPSNKGIEACLALDNKYTGKYITFARGMVNRTGDLTAIWATIPVPGVGVGAVDATYRNMVQ